MKIYLIILSLLVGEAAFAQKEKPCGIKDGLKEGTCKTFFDGGTLASVETWEKGKKEGIATYYHKNGK